MLWAFSIYLEAVAILPQLFLVTKTGEAENITSHYLFALGSYRALYIINWIYRYYTEDHFDTIAVVAGIVQTVLYCDFFYLYVTKGTRERGAKRGAREEVGGGQGVCKLAGSLGPFLSLRSFPFPLFFSLFSFSSPPLKFAVLHGKKLQVLP